ncbi:MAG: hypothetical protein OXG11_04400, partial [Chloroflexi bacterium]|nr:hypothetical protein [Chloroflexota bacterium]
MPVNTRALTWAVEESGIAVADLDKRLKVPDGTVGRWIVGHEQPNMTQFKRLRSLLKRPAAVFFMDTPPVPTESAVSMRFAFGATNRSRSPEERHAIRDSSRVRKFVGGLWEDLGRSFNDAPAASTNEDPEHVADTIRASSLHVPIDQQMSWSSPAEAFRNWRTLIERMGILVFL